ncbi:hypothetical protein CsSME_00011818 [Camellia sinensis var. sinensis]
MIELRALIGGCISLTVSFHCRIVSEPLKDYTPTKIQTTQGVDGLSGTTRKVAQYLKGKSSVTRISEDIFGDLIMNELIEGKIRKVCARMFYETLESS